MREDLHKIIVRGLGPRTMAIIKIENQALIDSFISISSREESTYVWFLGWGGILGTRGTTIVTQGEDIS
ncbi:hypothetical protein KJ713_02935 [Patescibacteria group bacterium]|nr:hypothetical protein [Patescibacteria group bacterium]